MLPKIAACTIISANYLAYARVLARSFRLHHPEAPFFVLLVDQAEDDFVGADEPFELIRIEELPIPNLAAFLFRYTVLEANTATKPFLLAHLLASRNLETIVYLDPDIRLLRPMDLLIERLATFDIVITPHLDSPIDDGNRPDEQAIMSAGTYNLGFIALRAGDQANRMLAWWSERLLYRCLVRIEEGLFVDQRWIDLVPGLFDGVHILRDPGHNAAYWNLHGRQIAKQDGVWQANGRPLIFFHFSGIDPERPDVVSRHQTRFTIDDVGEDLQALLRAYGRDVLDAGHATYRSRRWGFNFFADGMPIPDVVRSLFREGEHQWSKEVIADPRQNFRAVLLEVTGGPKRGVSRLRIHDLLFAAWRMGRLDPRAGLGSRREFYAWLRDKGRHNLKIPDELLGDLSAIANAVGAQSAPRFPELNRKLAALQKRTRTIRGRYQQLGTKFLHRLGARTTSQSAEPPRMHASTSGRSANGDNPDAPCPAAWTVPGVLLVGYLDAPSGMGQAARAIATALEAAAIPYTPCCVDALGRHRALPGENGPPQMPPPHAVNLFVINADQVQLVIRSLGTDLCVGRRNIGVWLWELDTFPPREAAAFDYLDEVWTPSLFCVDAFSAIAPIPVRRLPLPIEVPSTASERAHFQLPETAFVVLFVWSYYSVAQRKNPLGALKAFQRAFGDDPNHILVLKCVGADSAREAHAELRRVAGGAPNVRIIEDELPRAEVNMLMASCDVYLSLHRSEGFGLTLAEAMALGKPVVATDYSATTDFANIGTAWPVAYELVPVGEDAGPYPADARWAEPDLEHAAAQLRSVATNSAAIQRIAERGRNRILTEFSKEAVGRKLADLLSRIPS